MLYLYDESIADDLNRSFNPDNSSNCTVKVVDAESMIAVNAQIAEGKMKFPMVGIMRDPNYAIDESRSNFTWAHKGVPAVFDNENNLYYSEKSLPVKLTYTITILATNTADMDEMIRELLFKYNNMYFLTIKLPYESDRKIRFGIKLEPGAEIQRESGQFEYSESGSLYRSKIPVVCDGCVLLNYTPSKLTRARYEYGGDMK